MIDEHSHCLDLNVNKFRESNLCADLPRSVDRLAMLIDRWMYPPIPFGAGLSMFGGHNPFTIGAVLESKGYRS